MWLTSRRFNKQACTLHTVVCSLLLYSCSARQIPAPVSVLNSQPETSYSVFDADTYVVKKGDTLFSIAWYSGNDYRDLAHWNRLGNSNLIYVGQTLKIRRPSVNKPADPPPLNKAPPTSLQKPTKPVESTKNPAYGEKKQDVSQPVAKNKNKAATATFPITVNEWVWPANGKVIETFKTTGAVNRGIDIQATLGSPVLSAAAGKVVYTGNALRGYGNLVIVKHSETFLSAYAHNDKIIVKERDWVKAGQQIATVGNSGTDSTKLHFEVRYRGKSLDPMRFLTKKNK